MNKTIILTNIEYLKFIHEKICHTTFTENDKDFLMINYNVPEDIYDFLYSVQNKPKFIEFFGKSLIGRIDTNETYESIYKFYLDNKIPNDVLTYIFTNVSNDTNQIVMTDDKENEFDTIDIDKEIGNEVDTMDIDEELDNFVHNFKFRESQKEAIQNTIKQNFVSGIHNQIMGAGKSIIALKLIWEHYKKFKGTDAYIYMCDKQEILRGMFFEEDKNGKLIISQTKIEDWNNKGIINLTKFLIVDCVNEKPKNIFENLHTIHKPKLLIINNKFLTLRDYEKIIPNKETLFDDSDDEINGQRVALIELDECHSISAPQTYKALKCLKYEKRIPIIGFSATPLRPKAESKLCDIFSKSFDPTKKNKTLNIISTYNLIDAIQDEVILPFKYICVEVNKPVSEEIIKENRVIETNVIDKILHELPYKKFACWNRNIDQMEKSYKFYTKKYPNMKMFMSSFKDNYYKSQGYNCSLEDFYKCESNAMLFCVNRCREGSDINRLDCGVYLDAVRNRSILVAMQTSGRTVRPDKEGKKTHGVIIDMFVPEEGKSIESLTVEKIMGYYNGILNLSIEGADDTESSDMNEFMKQYFEFLKLKNNTFFNEETNEIIVKVDEKKKHDIKIKFELTTKTTDWSFIKTELNKAVDKQFNVDKEQKFKIIINKLKELDIFEPNTDFWEAYKNIQNKENLGLPEDIYNENKEIWDTKTWYEILDIKIPNYKTIDEIKKIIWGYGKSYYISKDKYLKLAKTYDLPYYPEELYKFKGVKLNDNILEF